MFFVDVRDKVTSATLTIVGIRLVNDDTDKRNRKSKIKMVATKPEAWISWFADMI